MWHYLLFPWLCPRRHKNMALPAFDTFFLVPNPYFRAMKHLNVRESESVDRLMTEIQMINIWLGSCFSVSEFFAGVHFKWKGRGWGKEKQL